MRATAEANQDLRDSLIETSDEIDDYGERFGSARVRVEGLTGALFVNAEAIRSNAAAARAAEDERIDRERDIRLGRTSEGGLSGGTFEFTTETGGEALRERILRRNPGLAAAGPAQQSDLNIRGNAVPV